MQRIRDIMTDECVTITLEDNLYETACMMKDHNIGFIPVVEGKKMLGVVTDRDLAIRGYAEKNPGSTCIGEIILPHKR